MPASMPKRLAVGACGAFLALSAACSPTGSGTGGDTFTVGVTTLFPTGTFAEFVKVLDSAAEQHGMTFDVQDVSNDAGKESQVMSAFATRGVDLVVASVVSPTGSVAALQRLKDRQIPVVCYNTCLAPPQDQQLAVAFVTNDNTALGEATGKAAARYIQTELGGTATVAYLTCETYDVCKQRRAGLEQGLASVTTNVVASQEGFVVDKAVPVATAMLAAHPDIDVILAENEDAVIAAAQAVKDRGLVGRTVVFGIGINPTVAQHLLAPEATVRHTTGQDAAAWATEVIAIATRIRDGGDVGDFTHYTAGPEFSHGDGVAVERYLSAA